MKVKPCFDRVLVKRIESENKTPSGILIPDNCKEKPAEGEVIAVGTTVRDVKKGDKILFGKYSGTEIKIEGEKHLIMKEDEVLAIVEA